MENKASTSSQPVFSFLTKGVSAYRYTLNIKKLSYRTQWIEYPDIASFYTSNDIPPADDKPDGSLASYTKYTLPMIYDPNTKAFVSDSLRIAEYLDATYPDTLQLTGAGHAMIAGFNTGFLSCIEPAMTFLLPIVADNLNPPSEEFFRRTRKEGMGIDLRDLYKTGDWKKVEIGLSRAAKWYENDSVFVLGGDEPSFVDLQVASFVRCARTILGESSEEWNRIQNWNDGRWGELVRKMEKYEGGREL